MEDDRNGWYGYIPLATGVLIAYSLIWEGHDSMDKSITVALIALLGTIVIELIKTFKDGAIIKKIGEQMGSMHPKVGKTEESIETMKPQVDNIEKLAEAQSKDIGRLVSDLDHRMRMEAQFPQGMSGRDMIYAGSNRMMEENAQLNRQYNELNLLYHQAQKTISELREENTRLRSQVSELEAELQEYEPEF